MAKLERTLVVRGEACVVEYAVMEDGVTMPGFDMVKRLLEGAQPDPTVELPDELQPKFAYRLLGELDALATGDYPNHCKYLNDGIWELKADTFRLTFYDTDGRGNVGCTGYDQTVIWDGSVEKTLPDDFGSSGIIRVGYGFTKVGPKSGDENVRLAMRVREEDLAHDRT